MATSILGTFPILTHTKSQTDEYGFDYVSYQYTVKTSELGSYSVKKDDEFYGFNSLGSVVAIKTLSTGSTYVVDSVETKNTAGGLTDITINTVGSKNRPELNSPRIVLLSGGPLIFGLSGTPPNPGTVLIPGGIGYGIGGAGQSVEVKFLANGGAKGQQEVFTTYFSFLMPTTFRGISLPVPAQQPKTISFESLVGNSKVSVSGHYYGFICKTILTEKRGSLLLVTLTFFEAGIIYRTIATPTEVTSSVLYNFPRVG